MRIAAVRAKSGPPIHRWAREHSGDLLQVIVTADTEQRAWSIRNLLYACGLDATVRPSSGSHPPARRVDGSHWAVLVFPEDVCAARQLLLDELTTPHRPKRRRLLGLFLRRGRPDDQRGLTGPL